SLSSARAALHERTSRRLDQGSIPLADVAAAGFLLQQSAIADDRHAADQSVGHVEVVRGENDDRAFSGDSGEARGHDADGPIVKARERLIEEQQPWSMQQ